MVAPQNQKTNSSAGSSSPEHNLSPDDHSSNYFRTVFKLLTNFDTRINRNSRTLQIHSDRITTLEEKIQNVDKAESLMTAVTDKPDDDIRKALTALLDKKEGFKESMLGRILMGLAITLGFALIGVGIRVALWIYSMMYHGEAPSSLLK